MKIKKEIIVCSNALEFIQEVEDDSVDLIICDGQLLGSY